MQRHGHSGWAVAAAGLAVAALTVARLLAAPADAFDRVWAEDGRIFLADASRHGLEAFVHVYAGYLHAVPRLLAFGGAALPLEDYPAYTILASAAVVGGLAAFIYAVARDVVGPAWALVPAASLAITPALTEESLGNLTNLHWYLMLAAFWGLFVTPGSRRALLIAAAAIALLTALSSPFAVALLPAVWLLRRRWALDEWPVRMLLVGLALQVLARLLAPETAVTRDPGIPSDLGLDALTSVLGPSRGGTASMQAAAGVVFGAILLAAWFTARGGRRPAALAVALGISIYVASSLVNGGTPGRYEAAGAMFVVSALALLTPHANPRITAAGVALIALFSIATFPAARYRVSGAPWKASVGALRGQCAADRGSEPALPLSPRGWGSVRLPCSET